MLGYLGNVKIFGKFNGYLDNLTAFSFSVFPLFP